MVSPHYLGVSSFLHTLLLAFCTLAMSAPAPPSSDPPPPDSIRLRPGDTTVTTAPPFGSSGRGRTGSASPTAFSLLQLNLCNSGLARCYKGGRSIPEAAALIYRRGPTVVTANEICATDVGPLRAALAEAWPANRTFAVFMPAIDRAADAPLPCANGAPYGNAVLGRLPAATAGPGAGESAGVMAYGGMYARQDSGNEGRTFACAHVPGAGGGSGYLACATHLSAREPAAALAQGRALLADALPYLQQRSGAAGAPAVVGGDFNLRYEPGSAFHVQGVVPPGFTRKGDGEVQHVLWSSELQFARTQSFPLRWTDHPGWEVGLSLASGTS